MLKCILLISIIYIIPQASAFAEINDIIKENQQIQCQVCQQTSDSNLTGVQQSEDIKLLRAKIEKKLIEDIYSEQISQNFLNRKCLNGQVAQGKLIEFWLDFECPYCQEDPVTAMQQEYPEWCILVRHMPGSETSIEKGLIFESLALQSILAAKEFWQFIVQPINGGPFPSRDETEKILNDILEKYKIDLNNFKSDLLAKSTSIIQSDIADGISKISYTPTYIINGIRLEACNFTPQEMHTVTDLIEKARAKSIIAISKLIEMILTEHIGN